VQLVRDYESDNQKGACGHIYGDSPRRADTIKQRPSDGADDKPGRQAGKGEPSRHCGGVESFQSVEHNRQRKHAASQPREASGEQNGTDICNAEKATI
jgi:hypothetical protein